MEKNLLHKNRQITIIIIICTSLIILFPSFLLLAATSWNSDDYYVAHLYQSEGFHGLFHRIFTWSPRFFSEIILYFYYNTVPKLGKPFTGCMILTTWLLLLGSIFLFIQTIISKYSLLFNSKNKSENICFKNLLTLLITLILFTYFLNGHRYPPGEIYYVIVVSVAYLPTLAGIILNLNFFISQADSSNLSKATIFQLILFGIITSSSWEMGTVYQLFFSSCLFLILLLSSSSAKFNYLPFSRLTHFNRWKLFIGNLIPFLFSVYILFLLQVSRLTVVEDSSIGSPLARNFNASFMATIVQFYKELFFAWENHIDLYSFTYSLLYKLGFLLLLIILFCQAKIQKINTVTKNACFISITLLLIINFIITFSGYYQLGISSPIRQISFKVALIGLVVVIIALIVSSFLCSNKNPVTFKNLDINVLINSRFLLLSSFFLTFTLLVNFQFDSIKTDVLNLPKIIISNNQNWQINFNSNLSLAVYTQVPSYYVFRMSFEPGIYPACNHSDNARPVRYINYFKKQKLYVIPVTDKVFRDDEINHKLDKVSQEINKSLGNKIDFVCSFASGNVEHINQVRILDQVSEVHINETLEISGWVINPDKTIPKRVVITMEDDKNLLVDTTVDIPRPDIAEYFKNPALLNSGWKATFTPRTEWEGKTITFKIWAYNPDIKIANLAKDFTIRFFSSKQN
ncbi:MAG: hypothetical protein QNJ32_11480 [Xenococcaceae cyanobacterium MO_167.B27]|nr:hypothetical protein [Xenococcaceae cyanobacterium MO_167.B27]